jgi:HAMP domain-containing protein
MHGDHERIFLQPNCCADAHYGRQWCEHDVWGDDCEDHTPATEYVRADAIEALQAEVERLTFDGIHTCHDDCPRLPCVQRREIEALQAEVRYLANPLQAHKDALAQADPKP